MEITTPMMQHWAKIKAKYKDFIVFYRLGDFYEMFEEDAQLGSKVLNLTLTSRSGHPMCGVPYHAYKIYIKKLISQGYKVVICEQLEDPSKAKGMVKRGVTEVITPGTLIESDLLTSDNNFISSIYIERKGNIGKIENIEKKENIKDIDSSNFYNITKKNLNIKNQNYKAGICWCDVSSGEFFATELALDSDEKESYEQIYTFLEKIKPSEIIISTEEKFLKNLSKRFFTTTLSNSYFEGNQIDSLLNSFFSVYSIEDLGIKSSLLKKSINALILYLKENEINIKPILSKVNLIDESYHLNLDSRTIHNLEIFEPFLPIDKTYTLFSCINLTKTPMGRRLLKRWLNFPLKDKSEIENRYSLIEKFIDLNITSTISEQLEKIYDIERLFTKIYSKKANPNDLINLKYSILYANSINLVLEDCGIDLLKIDQNLLNMVDLIEKSIVEPPSSDFEQQVIKKGFDEKLDNLYYISNNANELLTKYQEELRKESGIQSLKIKYNKVFGYFIEVSKANLEKVPSYFIRKQTLVNNERFTTEYLLELEAKILTATDEFKEMQKNIFDNIIEKIIQFYNEGLKLAEAIAYIDVINNLSLLAIKYHWVKPQINDDYIIKIEEGRHPVLDIVLGKECIANDLEMTKNKFFHIITGPNMSGKSTYLRQSALILYLAHIGSFVPAKSCQFFILDAIFSRIGASDNIASGQSTFFVEMNETAKILNFATSRSFVILDEVGRGTATFDGMSLAYAICEYLITKIKCFTLFATHYHELTLLEDEYSEVSNYHMQVTEWEDKVIFLKKVIKGFSDKSYGIYVASLAAVPSKVIERAKSILEILSENEIVFEKRTNIKTEIKDKNKKSEAKNTLFEDEVEPILLNSEKIVLEKLKSIDLNELTPIAAINFLEQLKKDLENKKF